MSGNNQTPQTVEVKAAAAAAEDTIQLACFVIDELLCGVDINWVQEINQNLAVTQVPLSPDYVLGIMNLRGRIVTVINLGKKVGLAPCKIGDKSRVIIVDRDDEYIGLLVDGIKDVVTISVSEITHPPANIDIDKGTFFSGACKLGDALISILDVEAVLAEEKKGEKG
ncbi:MAG: chemotaxis protein CheW [Pseudomonadota bacterium]|nr:chemotaxis protein CheW [Pseudomonadota bacterium]